VIPYKDGKTSHGHKLKNTINLRQRHGFAGKSLAFVSALRRGSIGKVQVMEKPGTYWREISCDTVGILVLLAAIALDRDVCLWKMFYVCRGVREYSRVQHSLAPIKDFRSSRGPIFPTIFRHRPVGLFRGKGAPALRSANNVPLLFPVTMDPAAALALGEIEPSLI
jgi:hypothetical protein